MTLCEKYAAEWRETAMKWSNWAAGAAAGGYFIGAGAAYGFAHYHLGRSEWWLAEERKKR
jgi:hypothetical protein